MGSFMFDTAEGRSKWPCSAVVLGLVGRRARRAGLVLAVSGLMAWWRTVARRTPELASASRSGRRRATRSARAPPGRGAGGDRRGGGAAAAVAAAHYAQPALRHQSHRSPGPAGSALLVIAGGGTGELSAGRGAREVDPMAALGPSDGRGKNAKTRENGERETREMSKNAGALKRPGVRCTSPAWCCAPIHQPPQSEPPSCSTFPRWRWDCDGALAEPRRRRRKTARRCVHPNRLREISPMLAINPPRAGRSRRPRGVAAPAGTGGHSRIIRTPRKRSAAPFPR